MNNWVDAQAFVKTKMILSAKHTHRRMAQEDQSLCWGRRLWKSRRQDQRAPQAHGLGFEVCFTENKITFLRNLHISFVIFIRGYTLFRKLNALITYACCEENRRNFLNWSSNYYFGNKINAREMQIYLFFSKKIYILSIAHTFHLRNRFFKSFNY